jgi:hypothetical protein
LYGRALVVIAADRFAQRMVLPAAKQGCRERWFSHGDRAIAALEAIATPHLPASLAQLEAAVAEAHATYERTCAQAREAAAAAAAAAAKAKRPAKPRKRTATKKPPAQAKPAAPAGDTAAVARQDEARSAGPLGRSAGAGPCVRSCARARLRPQVRAAAHDARRTTPQGPSRLRVPSVRGHARGRWNPWKSRFFCAHFRTRRCSRPRTGFRVRNKQ